MSLHPILSRAAIRALVLAQFLGALFSPASVPLQAPPTPQTINVGGPITTDTTWTLANSPYLVTSSIRVEANVTLSIEPGVEVRFDNGTYLDIYGRLRAIGTAAQPITFTASTKTAGAWYGIELYGSSSATFDYVTVEYGGYSSSSANIDVSSGQANIAHSTIRHSSKAGVYAGSTSTIAITDTSLIANAGYAAQLLNQSTNPQLARLTASGNGVDGIAIAGNLLTDLHTWVAIGLPYIVTSSIRVEAAAELVVEPGVEVRFGNGTYLDIYGRLRAIGTVTQPITFTASTKTAGAWYGIELYGSSSATFDYVTVEYGGYSSSSANIDVSSGQANIAHSTIRYSSDHGIYIGSSGVSSTIETSRIIDNRAYGVFNSNTNRVGTVLAANNWWGSNSGPTVDTSCNPGGNGSRASANIAFRPFLTSATAELPLIPSSEAILVTITPRRWFAPANGRTRVYVTITVQNGAGQPLAGRRVRLKSSLGTVVDGGITDVNGQTLAYITSTSPGDAQITGQLDFSDSCEFARSTASTVTFTTADELGLLTDDAAPYLAEDIGVDPMPLVRGVPSRLSAKLTNPNDFPIIVVASFGYAQAGIGLAFGPVGEVHGKLISAKSTVVIEVFWTPSVSGRYCVQLEYTARAASGSIGTSAQQPHRSQRNLNVYPGPFLNPQQKNAIRKASDATDAISDGQFALSLVKDRAGIPGGLIQSLLFSNILDFIYDGGDAANCALAGGANCGGWKGPRLQLPGDTIGNLQNDPPSQHYRSVITVEPLTVTPLQPTPTRSPARTAALNALMESSLQFETHIFGAVVSYDRYAGAAEANELEWTSTQAGAYLFYLHQAANDMIHIGDRLDALIQVARSEGATDVYVTAEEYRRYQDRLRTQGFTSEEISAATLVGFNSEALEAIRQRRLSRKPEDAAGSVLEGWSTFAATIRYAGHAILNPPGFGVSISAGAGLQAANQTPPASLVRVFDTDSTIHVGNPLSQRATIQLKARSISLPPDWTVMLSPQQVTLDPGQVVEVTVRVHPGTAAVQGAQPRVAIEGYVANQLIGGIGVDIALPRYVFFDGKNRKYLPLVRR
jgi:hypothetical protein